jgi:hypothetical protein
MAAFDGVKVFSATMVADRQVLGEKVTDWITANAGTLDIVDTVVTQSSDHAFHCIAITIFYKRRGVEATTPRGAKRG